MIRIDVSVGLLAILAATVLGCTLADRQHDGVSSTALTDAYVRGKANFATGRLGLAVADFQAALDHDGPTVERLNALAATYDRIGRFDLADRYYREALAIDPSAAHTLNNIGYSYLLRGRADLAAGFLAKAKAAATDDPVISGNLSLATAAVEQKAGIVQMSAIAFTPAKPVMAVPTPRPTVYIEQTAKGVYRLVTGVAEQPTGAFEKPSPSRTFVLPAVSPKIEPMPAVTAAPVAAVVREPLPEPTPAIEQTETGTRAALENAFIEVSNGSGIEGSAARVRAFLREYGVIVRRLTNDQQFGHWRTVLFYRDGFRDAAISIASKLPTAISLERNDVKYSDLRLRLGRDTQRFDKSLASKTPTTIAAQQPALSLGEPAASGIFGLSAIEPMLTTIATPTTAVAREPLPEPLPASDQSAGGISTRLQTTLFEVSNGSGIEGSAGRVRTFLQERHIIVGYLTNDAWLDHQRTVLFYRDGFRDAATAIAAELPMAISLERDDSQPSDLRLRLGRDSEQFVKSLVFKIQTAKL